MIHHITYEVNKIYLTQELDFWNLLGFTPTGLRRRTRKQPPIHWLVAGDESHAIELLPVEEPVVQGKGHVCYCLDQRRWEILAFGLGRLRWEVEQTTAFFGHKRVFLHSPSGHVVELMLGDATTKAGPPLEEAV
jgi:hypothetical protein